MPDPSNQLADHVFQWCVELLVWLASVTGTTYKEINVIIFCVVWPLLTLALVGLCIVQRVQIARLRRQAASDQQARTAVQDQPGKSS